MIACNSCMSTLYIYYIYLLITSIAPGPCARVGFCLAFSAVVEPGIVDIYDMPDA